MHQINVPSKVNFLNPSQTKLRRACVKLDCSIVVGGDFNVAFDPDLDGSGGIKKRRIRSRT